MLLVAETIEKVSPMNGKPNCPGILLSLVNLLQAFGRINVDAKEKIAIMRIS